MPLVTHFFFFFFDSVSIPCAYDKGTGWSHNLQAVLHTLQQLLELWALIYLYLFL